MFPIHLASFVFAYIITPGELDGASYRESERGRLADSGTQVDIQGGGSTKLSSH